MTEKMLLTQALDERDLLSKKIESKISILKTVDVKKRNAEKTGSSQMSVEEFEKNAKASMQQIEDMIARYQRLDAAIVASNAATQIQTSYGTFTVAGAISLRNRLRERGNFNSQTSFEKQLKAKLEQLYTTNVQFAENKNKELENQAESMRLSILGREAKTKENRPLDVVDTYVQENTMEVIDPLDCQKKIQALQDKISTLIRELDTQLKISNATTMIEF